MRPVFCTGCAEHSMATTQPLSSRNSDSKINNDLLPRLLGYHVRLAQIAVFRDFATAFGEFDITPTLFASLVLIDSNPGLKQADLARAVQLDRSTVVSVIDNLEGRGLVERKRAAEDRRSNALSLTRKGKTLLDKLQPLVEAHEQRLVQNLNPEEQAELVSLLSRIFPNYR